MLLVSLLSLAAYVLTVRAAILSLAAEDPEEETCAGRDPARTSRYRRDPCA